MTENKSSINQKSEAVDANDNVFDERCITFGKNMRKARKEMGFTTVAFARFLDVSPAYVGLIERGIRTPSIQTLFKICDFLGKGVDEMVTSSEPKSRPKADLRRSESQVTRKRRASASLIETFDEKELNYIITVMKGLKVLSLSRQEDDAEDPA